MAAHYIARAKEHLRDRSSQPREDEIGMLLELFDSIIRDPESSTRDRLDAAAAIREMKGLDAPRKIASPDGEAAAAGLAQVSIQMLSLTEAHKESLLAASLALRGLAGPVVESQAIPLDAASSDGS